MIIDNRNQSHDIANFIESLNDAEMLFFILNTELTIRNTHDLIRDLRNDAFAVYMPDQKYDLLTNTLVTICNSRNGKSSQLTHN